MSNVSRSASRQCISGQKANRRGKSQRNGGALGSNPCGGGPGCPGMIGNRAVPLFGLKQCLSRGLAGLVNRSPCLVMTGIAKRLGKFLDPLAQGTNLFGKIRTCCVRTLLY
ncbi:MAG: hypothetical protein JJT95_14695 [Pararhodobacter sp.]|nr:hypothetical protein [Pararhodobacter sp.]